MRATFVANNHILIVESVNDKYFVEAVKKHLNDISLDIEPPICSIHDYECLDGLSQKKLSQKLVEVQSKIERHGISHLGILLDADREGISKRVALINKTLNNLGANVTMEKQNQWYSSNTWGVDISCHILNINGFGELETVKKHIKANDSSYADCLDEWRQCLAKKDKSISNKEFDKFWVSIYQRYDCCTKKDKKQAGRKCNDEASLTKGIWDFSHSSLKSFKQYLEMFK